MRRAALFKGGAVRVMAMYNGGIPYSQLSPPGESTLRQQGDRGTK